MGNVQAAPLSQLPLGQTLLTKGIVSQDQLNIALTEQKRFKAPLGKVLVQLGFVTEATIRDILSETLGQGCHRHARACLRQNGKFCGIATVDKDQPDRSGDRVLLNVGQSQSGKGDDRVEVVLIKR